MVRSEQLGKIAFDFDHFFTGLIIREASYGVVDSDDATQKLSIDVKIFMQALVRNSQLYIPGGDSKVGNLHSHSYLLMVMLLLRPHSRDFRTLHRSPQSHFVSITRSEVVPTTPSSSTVRRWYYLCQV